jgi:hypothetical protein
MEGRMTSPTYTHELVVTSCWCGIPLAIPEELYLEAKRTGEQGVYCPLGHTFVFSDTTERELQRTRKALAEERARTRAARDLLAQEERSHAATRGHLTRQKKRSAAGVCPCCNRTFQQLARHMRAKHPAYPQDGG